jgi:ubiquitin C-terminal hydrolase
MISILQCLIHCKPFISQILKKEPNDLIGITKELYELCKIQALDNYNLNSLTKFKNTLKNIEFCDGKQHDSMEFMRVLLEQINEELNLGQKLPYESLNYDNLSLNESFSIYNNNISQRENSIIKENFYITTISICECNLCKNISYAYEISLGLTLLLKEGIENLENLIENYFLTQKVKKMCQQCNKKVECNKYIKICELPEILILCIQRKGNEKPIEINNSLNLEKYLENQLITENNLSYEVKSVINHRGTEKEGHYYCHINIENKFYEFNDSKVEEKEFDFKNKIPYIIWYRKQRKINQKRKEEKNIK